MRAPLPVDEHLPGLVERLRSSSGMVLQAEPGAGKTTRVPRGLLEAGLAGRGEVLVLQPRRLAARLAARRVAEENGERVGALVGYQVRFEEVAGRDTRLRFLTEGVLTRRLLADPELRGVGVVVLDEFHERHLDGDLCLALLRRLQLGPRPDLKLVIMSATLDPEPVARFLGRAPTLSIPGRRFEVAIEHQQVQDDRRLDEQVASAVRRLVDGGLDGDVLVFLPGASEIRRAKEACEPLAQRHGLEVLPLHGDLPPDEQDRAVRRGERRKIILSTNVAETSVTLPGVVAVVDSGLARIAGHSAWSGLATLKVSRVSKASCVQRAGRAGRLRAGRCLRLYSRHDFDTRHEFELPEIQRQDLAEAALALHGAGAPDLAAFPWFEPPPPASLRAAEELLARLGATTATGALTDAGRRMLALPVHPRQARVLLEAGARGRGADGCLLAALLGERDVRREARALFGERARQAQRSGPSDLLETLALFREAESKGLDERAARSLELDPGAVQAVQRVRKSLERIARPARVPGSDDDEPLLLALLAGYPDRVARRRAPTERGPSAELVFAGGGSGKLSEQSVVRDAPFVVAVEAEERTGASRAVIVHLASRVEPGWLLDLFPERVRDVEEVRFNPQAERVDATSRLEYDGLVIEESRQSSPDPAEVSRVLAEAARARGVRSFADAGAVDALLARIAFAAGQGATVEAPGEARLDQALEQMCLGRRSFAELRGASVTEALLAGLGGAGRAVVERMAPERVQLPGGRKVAVHYEAGQAPWIESRLQDFFGMGTGPSVAGGKVPLVLHLLAPNGRDVQVTTDLGGFWERHYPSIRRELCRRYPRHAWPEDGRTAQPPPPRGR